MNAQIRHFNFYVANAALRDVGCSLAGDATFVENLARYTGPIVTFQLGLGFGALANDAIALTRSSDVESRSQPAFGHIDLLTSPLHRRLFERPILEWVYTDVIF